MKNIIITFLLTLLPIGAIAQYQKTNEKALWPTRR